jgi:hypothetical protein
VKLSPDPLRLGITKVHFTPVPLIPTKWWPPAGGVRRRRIMSQAGRLAQRESASFTPKRPAVRSCHRPPQTSRRRGLACEMDDLFIMSLPFRLELLLPDESSASAARWPRACWQRTPPFWDSGVTAARDSRYRSSSSRDSTGAFRFSPRIPPSACLGIPPNWLAQPPSHRIRLWGGFLTLRSLDARLCPLRSARAGSG